MKIFNKHDRIIPATQDAVGQVIDSLSGPDDALWPWEKWPPMILDSVLGVGASGGHGPVRYQMSEYLPGRRAAFKFDEAGLLKGVDGHHYFEVISRRKYVIIRHVLDGDCNFGTWLKWTFLVEPLHDTVIEDAFDKVESKFRGVTVRRSYWSPWVRFLRWMRARQRRRLEATGG
jgi:hypothetical protein